MTGSARRRGGQERVACVLRFDRVLKVAHLGLSERGHERDAQPSGGGVEKIDPPAGMIILAFADGALVRLEVECVEAELCDMGLRQPAQACAGHALSDPSAV